MSLKIVSNKFEVLRPEGTVDITNAGFPEVVASTAPPCFTVSVLESLSVPLSSRMRPFLLAALSEKVKTLRTFFSGIESIPVDASHEEVTRMVRRARDDAVAAYSSFNPLAGKASEVLDPEKAYSHDFPPGFLYATRVRFSSDTEPDDVKFLGAIFHATDILSNMNFGLNMARGEYAGKRGVDLIVSSPFFASERISSRYFSRHVAGDHRQGRTVNRIRRRANKAKMERTERHEGIHSIWDAFFIRQLLPSTRIFLDAVSCLAHEKNGAAPDFSRMHGRELLNDLHEEIVAALYGFKEDYNDTILRRARGGDRRYRNLDPRDLLATASGYFWDHCALLRELGELYPEAADHLSTVREDLSRGFSSVVEELSTALFVAERSGEMDVKDVFFACALLTPSQYRHLRSWQSDRISEERYQALRGEWHEIREQFNAPSRRTWLARIISRNAD